jgi:hypothetical protein
VTGTTEEIRLAFEQAEDLPYGRARIARLEELVEAEGAAAELGSAIRIALIPACLYGGEHQRVPALLAELLERYDRSPSWFEPEQRNSVRFSLGLAAVGLLQHPDVPLGALERILAAMDQRYPAAGESMAPVLRARFLLALQVSGPEQAQPEFEAWIAAPRSELSECEECERAEQVRQLAALGRHPEAVQQAMPVLDDHVQLQCEAQPVAMIAAVLGSLLESGLADRAAAEHIRAVRLIRDRAMGATAGSTGHTGRADHLLICARSGRLQRGLELIEAWLPWYARVGPPSTQLETATAAGRLLRGLAEAGYGHLVLTADSNSAEPTTVDELGARLAREARDLSARFDARNGTSTVGDLVERLLDAPPLPDLPLDALTRSPRAARARPPLARARRGRRAAGRDTQPAVPAGDPIALAQAFEEALKIDSQARCAAVLEAWRELRGARIEDGDPQAHEARQGAVRLDGWLAIDALARPELTDPEQLQAALAIAALAAERMHSAGLTVEALLYEQSFLLTAAQAGRIDLGAAAERIEQLTIEIGLSAGPGDAGLALSRLVLIREVSAAAGIGSGTGLDGSAEPSSAGWTPVIPAGDPLDAGLAALGSVPPDQLNHQHLRAACRLLRLRAADESPPARIATLIAAVAVLPDGVRPLERALAGADLAGALQDGDPARALAVWDQAIMDADLAGAAPLLGNLLAARAALRHALGDPVRSADDLSRAVPLLDEHAAPALGAQARLDLSRALLDLGRPFSAAEVAEAALADVTDLLQARGIAPDSLGLRRRVDGPDPGPPVLGGDEAPGRDDILGSGEVHLAGCSAFAAAEANATIGANERARELAKLSVDWHRQNDNLIAQAEAWQLAARLGGPAGQVAADLDQAAELAEAGGDWVRAATCRRERITAVKESEGLDAALVALAEAEAALAARAEQPGELDERLLRWHRLAVAEERARLLALGGRFREAMAAVIGLEDEYQELGDAWSARDLMGLRGQLRAELDDLDGALDDLQRAAEESQAAGDPAQAHGLGERLAAVLDEAGRPDEAERAWQRFCSELSPA